MIRRLTVVFAFLTSVCFAQIDQKWKSYLNKPTDVYVKGFQHPYLWYSSANGLSRRNVLTDEVIDFNVENSPITSAATSLAFKGNEVWVGFENGVGYYDGTDWHMFPMTSYTTYQEGVSSIAVHPDGSVWVCGFHSISRYHNGVWKIFGASDGVPYPDANNPLLHVGECHITSAGVVWTSSLETNNGMFNTTPGLIKYENGSFTLVSIPGHTTEPINDFDVVSDKLVVATNAGCYQLDGNQVTYSYTRNNTPIIAQSLVTTPGSSHFWTTIDQSLFKIDLGGTVTEHTFASLDLTSNLYQQSFFGVVDDNSDGFWLGSASGLRHKVIGSLDKFSIVDGVPAIPDFIFRCMVRDSNGNLWMGTLYHGLIKKAGETWSVFSGLPSNSVIESLAADAFGNIWVCWNAYTNNIEAGGLAKISAAGIVTHYNKSNSPLPGDFMSQLAFDNDGNLWAAMGMGSGQGDVNYHGLCKIIIENGSINSVTSFAAGGNGMALGSPSDMVVDRNGVVWLSYFGMPASPGQTAIPALSRFDGTSWTHFNYQNSNIPSMTVTALALDTEDNLYTLNDAYNFNTGAGAAIVKFNGINSTIINLPAGWNMAYLHDMVVDKQNKLWIASSIGVASYSFGVWTTYDNTNSAFPKVYTNSPSHAVGRIAFDNVNTKFFACMNTYPGSDGLVIFNESGFVSKQSQTIDVIAIADRTFALGMTQQLNATASSQLPVTFQLVSGSGSITGNILSVTAPGSIKIKVSQAGNDNYFSTEVEFSFCVNPGKPIITLDNTNNQLRCQTNGTITWNFNGAVIDGSTGKEEIFPNKNGIYKAKLSVAGCYSLSDSVVINRQQQQITFAEVTDVTFEALKTVVLNAVASSGLPVAYRLVAGPATVINNVVSLSNAGIVTIECFQNGNLNFLAADPVRKSFCVNPPRPTLASSIDQTKLVVTSESNCQWYRNDILIASNDNLRELIPAENGSYVVRTKVSGCTSESLPFVVARQNQQIQWEKIADRMFAANDVFTLTGVATSGLPVNYQLAKGNVQLAQSQVKIMDAGFVEITASQSGNLFFAPAQSIIRSFCINPPKPVITVELPSQLSVSAYAGELQWLHNDVAIAGTNSTTYTPPAGESGSYTVKVIKDQCTTVSDPFLLAGILENGVKTLYPNPTNGILMVDLEPKFPVNYLVLSTLGQKLASGTVERNQIDLSAFKGRIVIIKIMSGPDTIIERVIVN